MNHRITAGSLFSSLLPSCVALAQALGQANPGDTFDVEESVFRSRPFAWDLSEQRHAAQRPAFDAIVAEIGSILAAKAAADEAARLHAEANPSPESIWWAKLNGTITDAQTGIEIAASENVRNILTGQLVMVTTAINVGAITASTPQDIWDHHGVKHTMPASDLIGLILRHGQAWAAMFAEFAP